MKWNKDQIQKAFLVGMLCGGGLYYYMVEMLGPIAKREMSASKEIAALEPKLKEAKSKILRTNAIEAGDIHATEARAIYAIMKKKIPDGQPVAWLPTRFAEFFKQQGVGKPIFRSNPEQIESDFSGYKISSWNIDLSGVSFDTLGVVLADFENQEGLMQITNLQIDTLAADTEVHHAQITISTLVKSEK